MASYQFSVRGRVQGVGFRYATRRVAHELGVSGWVRNRADGVVEVLAQGPDEAVETLLAFLEQGPPGAAVATVELEDVEPDDSLEGFRISF